MLVTKQLMVAIDFELHTFIMSAYDLLGNSFSTEVYIKHLLFWLSLQFEEEEDCHLLFKSQ